MKSTWDAVIVGSGPNGLAAAIALAQAGWKTLVIEARDQPGGGTRTLELTLPGFRHDICAAVVPLAAASPFLSSLALERYGVDWLHSPAVLAHPLDDEPPVVVRRSIIETAASLGVDGGVYRRLAESLARDWLAVIDDLFGPLHLSLPNLAADVRFGSRALLPAHWLSRLAFRGERARALFAGMAAHSILPLERALTAAFGLALLATAHTVGWMLVRGGSQRLSEALTAHLASLGGSLQTGWMVRSLDELPPARVVLFDLSPRAVLEIAGNVLPRGYVKCLERYRYGPGVFKMDWALDAPIPWRDAACSQAATLHLGGSLAQIAAAERAVWRGEHPAQPFVLLSQPSLFDSSRAPHGKHTAWAYCHVPNGSNVDCSAQIEAQVERFAPGFRQRVLARCAHTARQMEAYNPNYVGGDINTGVQDWRQFFTRPVLSVSPYRLPARGLYLCSSATPPGGGVHGLCGYHAAQAVLEDARHGRLNG
ncbi:MAG: NAD(P)/FAD-dependent oxidoreductase [Chloroflexota bacterium]|jgi:phytoene dehydrogenase-like protein